MDLQNLTNSPVQSPYLRQKIQLSIPSDVPVGSDQSEAYSSAGVDDGICDALRITSEQLSPLASTCESQPDRGGATDLRQAGQIASVSGKGTGINHCATERPTRRSKSVKQRRGWSLNDLDCLTQIQPLLYDTSHQCSVASVEALEAAGHATVYPHLPRGPPPLRRSTPDGIPSFGTFEAQRLRLAEPSWLHRLGKLVAPRFLRVDNPEAVEEDSAHATNADQSSYPAREQSHYPSSAEMLRRASGMTRPISISATSTKLRRSSLPRGVKRASLPGDLAIASDGSHVRGRFGQRVSGHGVGQRTIDVHPLARRQGTSAVEEEVRAINKACDREIEREQYYAASALDDPQRPAGSSIHSYIRQNPDTSRHPILAPSPMSRGRVHQSSMPQNQGTGLHGTVQTSSRAISTYSSPPRYHSVFLRNRERHISNPNQAEGELGSNQVPGSPSVHRNSMPEPALYGHFQSEAVHSQGNPAMPSTVEETTDNPEQHQLRTETDQTRNLRMEIEIC